MSTKEKLTSQEKRAATIAKNKSEEAKAQQKLEEEMSSMGSGRSRSRGIVDGRKKYKLFGHSLLC